MRIALGLVALTALMPLACSSTKTPAGVTASDAAATASDSDSSVVSEGDAGTPDAPAVEQTCGAPPYVTLGIVVRAASADGNGALIEGARLTTPLCADKVQLSGADGTITGKVSKGVPFYVRFEAKDYLRTLVSEQKFDTDTSPIVAPIPPAIFSFLLPGFTEQTSAILIGVMKDGGSGACDSLDGITLEVAGQPGAKVTYFTNDPIPMATGGTTTTDSGRAVITNLAIPSAGGMVSVRGTKAGCTVKLAKDSYTGRAPLEAGFVTLAPAYLSN